MNFLRPTAFFLATATLFSLIACNNITPSTETSPTSTNMATTSATSTPQASTSQVAKGGMVVESQGIHLELIPEQEANQTHMDLLVQKSDTHASVPTAKVMLQVQTPSGKTETVSMKYDVAGQHFAGVLPSSEQGQYQVKTTVDIGGKIVDGRFSFKR